MLVSRVEVSNLDLGRKLQALAESNMKVIKYVPVEGTENYVIEYIEKGGESKPIFG